MSTPSVWFNTPTTPSGASKHLAFTILTGTTGSVVRVEYCVAIMIFVLLPNYHNSICFNIIRAKDVLPPDI